MKLAIALIVWAFATSAHGQGAKSTPGDDDVPKPVPTEISLAGSVKPDISRFLNVRTAVEPSLSPDGTRLAFQTAIAGSPHLWVVDASGGWPQQLSFGESVTFHEWSPAGTWIAYGTDRGGNEREGYYLIDPEGTVERELLAPSEAFRVYGGFTRDGKKIAYATTERNGRDFDIHLIDVATGEDREVFRGRMGLYAASWRPDGGAVILSEARGEDASDVLLLDISSGKLASLFKPEVAARYDSFSWVPDGSGFYLVTNQDREFAALAYYNVAQRTLTLVETPEHDVEQAAVSADGEYLAWVVSEGGYSQLRVRNLKAGKNVPAPALPRGTYRFRWAGAAPVAAISVSGPQIAGDIWTWNATSGKAWRSTNSATAGLDMSKLTVPEHYSFQARDGIVIHGLLYRPTGLPAGARTPVLLSVHGGPTLQAMPRFNAIHQYLLSRGIAIFDLNYRGSTGYGKSFARLNDRRLRENELYDLADAVNWLRNQAGIDANRTAVMGGSYGGYLAMAALSRLPDVFTSGVAMVGVSNWLTALEGASPVVKASDRIEYGDIDDPADREFFRQISPITHIGGVRAPVLVIHGANDPRDPVAESDEFVRAIRARGGDVEYLRFPDEGHHIRKLSNQVIAYRRIAAFLERTLGIQGAEKASRTPR